MERLVNQTERIDIKYEPLRKIEEIKELVEAQNGAMIDYLRTIDYDCNDGNCSD